MKEYLLKPITETAEQARQAKGQKGKIAKQIVLGIDAHLRGYQLCRKIDAGGLQPVQSFSLEKLLLFGYKQLGLAERVYAVYEPGLWVMCFTASSGSWASRRWFARRSLWKQAASANITKLMPVNWPGGSTTIWAGIATPYGLCVCPVPNRSNCELAVANTINWCARAKPLERRGVA